LKRIAVLVSELLLGPVLVLALSAPTNAQPRNSGLNNIPPLQLPVDKPDPPYALNYADEAAQTLGIKQGNVDLFSGESGRDDGVIPDVKGGIYHGRTMLQFQWRLAE
jgi:hypothetical protein